MAGILHVSVFGLVVIFSGAPLPTPMRPKHIDSAAGWYLAVHVSVLSSGVTFSGAPLPTPMHAKHRDSVDGWYPAVNVFSSPLGVLPFSEPLPLLSAFPCTSTFCPAL